MGKKVLKSLAVVLFAFAGALTLGVFGFSRQYYLIMPFGTGTNRPLGAVLISIGAVMIFVTAAFILKHFIFLPKIQMLDSVGNILEDDSTINIGSVKVRRIVVAALAALLGVILMGLGIGMMFSELIVYILYLSSIAFTFAFVGLVFFLFSVIHHKIRRRFAWIVSLICVAAAVMVISLMVPAVRDVNVDESGYTAVTGTVSSITADNGIIAGPGNTEVVIKGTSGETITLRFGGNANELDTGSRYTFYYLPNTRFIMRAVPAESVYI